MICDEHNKDPDWNHQFTVSTALVNTITSDSLSRV